jgi:hypothetical protein
VEKYGFDSHRIGFTLFAAGMALLRVLPSLH